MELRDYQKEAIAEVHKKLTETNKQVLVLATGTGKAQPLSALVLTPTGWKTMGALTIGEKVITQSGKATKITGIYPQGKRKVYKITCSDTTTVECDGEHLWNVQTKSQKSRQKGFLTKTTRALATDLTDGSGANKWFLPIVKPVHFTPQKITLDPYLLGYLIANGSFLHNRVLISSNEPELIASLVKEYLPASVVLRKANTYDSVIIGAKKGINPVRQALQELKLTEKYSFEKFIPQTYLYNALPIRIALLQGLMDGDGTISKDKNGSAEYSTNSEQLAKDICELVRSLGGCTRIRIKKTTAYTYKGERRYGRPCYRITVNLADVNPFLLSHKAKNYRFDYNQGQTKAITDIQFMRKEACQCISVADTSQLYVTNEYIVTHNTVIFSHLSWELIKQTGKKVLILAHREELLNQAKNKLLAVNPELKVGVEQAGNSVNFGDNSYIGDHQSNPDVIVASVPTLGREGSVRIQKFDPKEFCLIVVDEAHHSSGDSYKNIFKYFGVLKKQDGQPQDLYSWNKDCLLLGVTATPSRNDNRGLDTVFDKVVYNFDIIDAIKRGFLSRIKAFRVRTMTDLTEIKKTAGDFNIGELADAVNNDNRNELIIRAYRDIVPNQQAIVFATSVDHTMELADQFNQAGVPTSFVTGTTNKDERAQRLADFQAGKLKVMVNMGVLTEGIDIPSIEAVLMARPTQSSILYRQMLGRGSRLYPGKENLTVIDFVDITSKQSLQSTASLLGLNGTLDFKGRDILDVQLGLKELLDIKPDYNLDNLDIDNLKYAIEEVDLLAGLKIPDELAPYTKYEWYRYNENTYRVNLGFNEVAKKYITITETITEEFIVKEHIFDIATKEEKSEELKTLTNLALSVTFADDLITTKHSDSLALVDTTAKWKKDKPSDKQIEWLKKMRVPEEAILQLSKGEASRLLTKLFNKRK